MTITRIRQQQVKGLEEKLKLIKEQIKTFKQPVDLFVNLPIVDNNDGDLRVCLEDGNIYIWNETESEWNLSSGKGGAYTRTLSFIITEQNKNEINTKIRFDETTDLQTSVEMVNVYLNGMLVDPSEYSVSNVNDELIITWLSQDQLEIGDNVNVQYYDTTGGVSSSGSSGSKYEHPDTHPANMIVFNDGETFEEKLLNGTLKGEQGESGVSAINDNSTADNEVWSANKVNTEIESLKQSVSNGKQLIATAITDKGVSASGDETFSTLSNKIKNIETLKINLSYNKSCVANEDIKLGDVVKLVKSDYILKKDDMIDLHGIQDRWKCVFNQDQQYLFTVKRTASSVNQELFLYKLNSYGKYKRIKGFYKIDDYTQKYWRAFGISPSGKILMVAGDNKIKMYENNNDVITEVIVDHDITVDGNIIAAAINEDYMFVITLNASTAARNTYLLRKTSTSNGTYVYRTTDFTDYQLMDSIKAMGATDCVFSNDGKYLGIIGYQGDFAKVINFRGSSNYECVYSTDIIENGCNTISFSHDSKAVTIAVNGSDSSVSEAYTYTIRNDTELRYSFSDKFMRNPDNLTDTNHKAYYTSYDPVTGLFVGIDSGNNLYVGKKGTYGVSKITNIENHGHFETPAYKGCSIINNGYIILFAIDPEHPTGVDVYKYYSNVNNTYASKLLTTDGEELISTTGIGIAIKDIAKGKSGDIKVIKSE